MRALLISVVFTCGALASAKADVSLESVIGALRSQKVKRQSLQTYQVLTTTKTFMQGLGKAINKQATTLKRYQNGALVEHLVDGKPHENKASATTKELGFEANVDDFLWQFSESGKPSELKIIGKPKPNAPKEISTVVHYLSAETFDLLRSDMESTEIADGVSGLLRIHIDYTLFRGIPMPSRLTMNGEGKAMLVLSFNLKSSATLEYK